MVQLTSRVNIGPRFEFDADEGFGHLLPEFRDSLGAGVRVEGVDFEVDGGYCDLLREEEAFGDFAGFDEGGDQVVWEFVSCLVVSMFFFVSFGEGRTKKMGYL